MDVTATSPDEASFPGAESPGTTIGVDAGAYSVDESGGPSGYSKALSADCSGAIAVGESKTCTITNDDIPVGIPAVTDSSLCVFDRDPGTPEREFRLLFTPDVKQGPAYKLTASNPGQYYYNVFYVGDGAGTATISMTIPYPFVTQGAMPVHTYSAVEVVSINGLTCFSPTVEGLAYPISIELDSYAGTFGTSTTISLTVDGLAEGDLVYANIHLDYGLKRGEDRYLPAANDGGTDAVDSSDTTQVLIADHGEYIFSSQVDGQTGSDSVFNLNEFKKIPGVGGFVHTASGDPVAGAVVQLGIPGSVTKAAATSLQAVTDEDGWYMIEYKHIGKPQVYRMDVWDEDGNPIASDVEVPLKGNAYTEVNFTE
jgi:hypothetical protein